MSVSAPGHVSVADVEAVIKPSTKLVSIMLANNEIGTVQSIAEIGRLLNGKGILLHNDAVQAVRHISVNVDNLSVDFLTSSAHNFSGAIGSGVLYKRSGLELLPLVFGG